MNPAIVAFDPDHGIGEGAIEAIHKQGDRHVLRLSNGLEVPVSRTYLLAVREAVPAAA